MKQQKQLVSNNTVSSVENLVARFNIMDILVQCSYLTESTHH